MGLRQKSITRKHYQSSEKRGKRTIKLNHYEKFICSLAFIVLSIVGYLLYNVTYSEGVRSGQLIKFSTKGSFLNLGRRNQSRYWSTFSFSVLDKTKR
jgi:hypothetical protein